MSTLDELKKRRGTERTLFTKRKKVVSIHVTNARGFFQDESDPSVEVVAAQTALDLLKVKHVELVRLNEEIAFHADYEDWYSALDAEKQKKEDDSEVGYELLYTTTSGEVSALHQKLEKMQAPPQQDPTVTGQGDSEKLVETLTKALAKLQTPVPQDRKRKIDIPKYKGDKSEFEIWQGMVNGELKKSGWASEEEKSYFVLSLLEGQPKKDCIALKDPSFTDLLAYLESKYGDTKLKVEQALFDIASISNISMASKDLDAAYTALLAAWNYLLKRHDDVDSLRKESWIFTALVKPKMPRQLLREWELEERHKEKGKDDDATSMVSSTAAFPESFDLFLQNLYDAHQLALRTEAQSGSKFDGEKDMYTEGSALSLVNQNLPPPVNPDHKGSGQGSGGVQHCVVCKGRHPIWKCYKFKGMSLEERRNVVKQGNLCFRCLSSGHLSFQCTFVCGNCGLKHNKLCCPKLDRNSQGQGQWKKIGSSEQSKKPEKPKEEKKEFTTKPEAQTVVQASVTTSSEVSKVLPTAEVGVLTQEGKRITTQLLFDSGSEKSYVSSLVVAKVKPLFVGTESITYAAFGGSTSKKKERNVYKLTLETKSSTVSIKCVEIETIVSSVPRKIIPISVLKSESLDYADEYQKEGKLSLGILIGIDLFWTLMKSTSIPRSLSSNLVAQESVFGWIVSGSVPSVDKVLGSESDTSAILLIISEISDAQWQRIWNIDAEEPERDENSVLANFDSSIRYCEEEGRYEVRLPWKDNVFDNLEDNYDKVRRQFERQCKRLQKDPNLESHYYDYFSVLEKENIITQVKSEDLNSNNVTVYLTHRPVIREKSSSTKVRPVFNASLSGSNKVSLNDCLETGPNLLPRIEHVLMRARRWSVSINSDVMKAFLQVKVAPCDQDALRFLLPGKNGDTRIMKFLRIPFGLTSSPFLLEATIKFHLSHQSETPTIQELKSNLYMDDWISGADSEEEAKLMYEEACQIMEKAGMVLTKWSSNRDIFELDDLSSQSDISKILGLAWCAKSDKFVFQGFDVPSDLEPTKRLVLSTLARIYDPLGMITPYAIVVKILFQDLWSKGLGWDDPLPEKEGLQFQNWICDLKILKQLEIPRHYGFTPWDPTKVKIVAFSDASKRAYGCAVYLKFIEDFHVPTLISAKANVAPIKPTTLPRLELLGCLSAAKLVKSVVDCMKLPTDCYECYTDSMISLHWIRGETEKLKPWVKNRVQKIRDLTDPLKWSFVPGHANPADLLTRGLKASDLIGGPTADFWFHGPKKEVQDSIEKVDQENSVLFSKEDVVLIMSESVDPFVGQSKVMDVHDISRCSTFPKAVRAVAWSLRFIKNVGKIGGKKKRTRSDRNFSETLSHEECTKAFQILVRQEQSKTFIEEIRCLEQGKNLPKGSKLMSLAPFLDDDGILRRNTRLEESKIPYSNLYPIILPKSHFSRLLVRFTHSLTHAGVDTLISDVRTSYWIFGLRVIAKNVKKECLSCARQDARRLNETAAPLPRVRVTEAPPFSVCGIDFGGYLSCSDEPGKKFSFCLFTCAVIRGIHCELTDSQKVPDFLLAYRRMCARRMCARRGRPSVIYSDNAQVFVSARKTLLDHYGPECPEWRFIAPLSPWWGGWYERLIGSVKSGLRKVIGRRSLSKVELATALTEVEAVVNSRPLTFVGDTPDSSRPLTPNHFLLCHNNASAKSLPVVQENVTSEVLSKREEIKSESLKKFWSVWSQEYLKNLPVCVPSFNKKGSVKEGMLVLIRDSALQPRLQWPIGVVVKLHTGKDGLTRAVDVRTADGVKTRDVRRLHCLEVY